MERSLSDCVCSDRCIRLCKEQNAVAHGDVTECCEKCVEHSMLKQKELGGSPAAFIVSLEPLQLTLGTEISVVE